MSAPETEFTRFVMGLVTNALLQMGVIPHPDGVDEPPNWPLAQQSIDFIAMLQDKTQGNLSPEEAQFMKKMLYDLRLRFVAAKAKASAT